MAIPYPNGYDDDFMNITKMLIDIINDQGIKILSGEGIEDAINNWLTSNEFKPKAPVPSFSDLPVNGEMKELRLVQNENVQYIYDGEEWVVFGVVNADGLTVLERKIDNAFLSPLSFGAVGDGVSDDTQALLDTVDALPDYGTLHLPAGYIFAIESTTIAKPLKITGTGIIKWIDGYATGDHLIRFDAPVFADDFRADGNVENMDGAYANAGHVIVNNGNNSVFRNVVAVNSHRNTFVNRAPNVAYLNCESDNAGYAGFNNTGSGTYINRDCKATNYKFKGFSDNSNAKKIIIDNFQPDTDSLENGVDPILVDPNGKRVGEIVINDTTIDGTNRSNCIKLIDFDRAILNNVRCLSDNTLYALHTYITNSESPFIEELIINDSYFVGRLDLKNIESIKGKNVVIDDFAHSGVVTTVLNPLGVKALRMSIDNLTIKGGSSSATNIDVDLLEEPAYIKGYKYEGYDESKNAIGLSNFSTTDASEKRIRISDFRTNANLASSVSRTHILNEDEEKLYTDQSTGVRYLQKVVNGELVLEPL